MKGSSLRIFIGCFVLFLTVSLKITAQNEVFNQANTLYNEEQYQQAIEKYQSILNSNKHSAELYYNLANAYMKSEQLGQAIYYYEKAKQLAPDDEDILNNLAFAQKQVIDVITPVPKIGFNYFIRQVAGYFSVYQWAILSIVFAFLLSISYLIYAFSQSSLRKRIFFTAFLVSIVFIGFSVAMGFVENQFQKNHKEAVIFSLEVQVKNEPLNSGQVTFLLHEGTKVEVTETLNGWVKIKLADGKVGWLDEQSLKIL